MAIVRNSMQPVDTSKRTSTPEEQTGPHKVGPPTHEEDIFAKSAANRKHTIPEQRRRSRAMLMGETRFESTEKTNCQVAYISGLTRCGRLCSAQQLADTVRQLGIEGVHRHSSVLLDQ